jgi:hypothetical protein
MIRRPKPRPGREPDSRDVCLVVVSQHNMPALGLALRRKGDRAWTVNSAHEAWHLLAHSARRVTGLVVSLQAGGEEGLNLARDVQEDYPDLRIAVVAPGHHDDLEFPLLVEPFTSEDVRSVLIA